MGVLLQWCQKDSQISSRTRYPHFCRDGGAVRVPALGLGSLPEENLEWILLQICINSTATAPCGESHRHENISTVPVPGNPESIPEVVGIVALSSGAFTSWFYVV